ncbi:MAG TPA: YihY/virulence factor BrkB family protein [Candidatus Dormibacteraeota bacterium]|nr:YihY/virulence factor BrkB family protein [Candidatus Dormibacteraeota bacterium]
MRLPVVGEVSTDIRRFTPVIVRTVWNGVLRDDCVDLAAQMSFFFVTSLFPFLVVIGAIVGWLPSTGLWTEMVGWIAAYLPKGPRHMVFRTILSLQTYHSEFFSYGLAVTIWVASSGFVSLMESLSLAYGVKETRGFWKKRVIALTATAVGASFAVVSFALLTFGHQLAVAIAPHLQKVLPFPFPWQFARWGATLFLMVLGLDMMSYFLPNIHRKWRWLTPGTVFVVLGLVSATTGFGYYVSHFGNYPQYYGAMAGFVILVMVIYLASLVLLIGAEIDSVRENLRTQRSAP